MRAVAEQREQERGKEMESGGCAFIHLIETVESAGRVINFPFEAGPEYVYVRPQMCTPTKPGNVRVRTFLKRKPIRDRASVKK